MTTCLPLPASIAAGVRPIANQSWIPSRSSPRNRMNCWRRKQAMTACRNVNENLTPRMRNLVAMLWSEWKDLELQIMQMNDEVERIASSDAACRRLRQIPGIGPLVATAIVASIGNGAAFRKGREFAAWMGLLPKQHSTGGKARLYGISKRGNSYLRKILIHGARAVVLRSKRDRIAMGAWMTSLETRAPRNVLIVATAHKLARTIEQYPRH